MKLGLNTWLWAYQFNTSHLGCIKKASELGAEALDFFVANPWDFPVKEVASELEKTKMEPIVTTAMAGNCNPISSDHQERNAALEFMKKLLDIAAEMHVKIVGGVDYAASNYHTGKPRSTQEIEWCVDYLQKACEYAAQYDIVVTIEPVKRFETHFLNTAEQAIDLIKMVGTNNLKVHLDTFHMNIEEADLPGAIRSCGNNLGYMHLVENNRDTPGMGHISWLEIFQALKDIDYQGCGCIETFNPRTLDVVAPLTYLTRQFSSTPEELAKNGLNFLKTTRALIWG